MPREYDGAFMALLADSARAAPQSETPVVPLWPLVGWEYTGELMVIGRSANGWIQDWPIGDLREFLVVLFRSHNFQRKSLRDLVEVRICGGKWERVWLCEGAGRKP